MRSLARRFAAATPIRFVHVVHVLHVVGLVLVVAVSATPASAVSRVYVAPLAGATVDGAVLDLVEERILVATRGMSATHDVVGAADVQGVLDAEAARQAMGCDSTSCANEIADALDADELVLGTLGHIGDTWQLTLTRTERKTLKVLARVSRESRGATPEGLLPQIEGQVGELFDRRASALAVVGTTSVVAGAIGVLVGAGLYAWSWGDYVGAESALERGDVRTALEHKDRGVALLSAGLITGGAGLVVAGIGGSLLVVDMLGGGE